ncbi:MAG: LytTR family DNA-binding domain-containing protein [Polaribacter sp.]|nr:LytTR family DNA-binding domain-containing protein [Polaribacter sp.]
MNINCLIIDDEPSSQMVIKTFLDRIDFLQLSGVCNNAVEAISELNRNPTIDLLFLDINMPKISGLSFYKSLQHQPFVIFTTAYPEYALEGFEVNAIDYLLKPFSFDRFFIAVNKVVEKFNTKNDNTFQEEFIIIKADKKLHKITLNNIYYIEAFGDYVKIYLQNSYLLTYSTFSKMLDSLPSKKFIQTHKSFAINLSRVTLVDGNQVVLSSLKVPIGQKYKAGFIKRINNG